MKKLVIDASSTGKQKFDIQGKAIQVMNYPLDCVAYVQFGSEKTIYDLRKKIIQPKNFFDSFEIQISKAPSTYYKKIVMFVAETSDEIDFIYQNDYLVGLILGKLDGVKNAIYTLHSDTITLLSKIVNNTADIANASTANTTYVNTSFIPPGVIGASPATDSYPDIE